MAKNNAYQMSARQIFLLAISSALIAVGATALLYNFGKFWTPTTGAEIAFNTDSPRSISDPSGVSDEQNNIEVYKAISPGVAYINTTSVSQGFWGEAEEGKGTGSGSVIDTNGDVLTNFHVIEGAQKLTVSFGGDKTYTAKVIGSDEDTDLAVIRL